jgi:hypothetical protein
MAYESTKIVKTLRFPGDTTNQYNINAVALDGMTKQDIEQRFSTLESFDALRYQGALAAGATLPAANKGDVYKVTSKGTIAGAKVEVGDMLICNTDGTAENAPANWDIIQGNVDVDAILAHHHTGNVKFSSSSKTLTHSITPTEADLTATFSNGSATVTGNHGHTASGSFDYTPGGSIGDTSITPEGTVKLTAPTTAATGDVTLTPSGTVAESTTEFVTGVTVSEHAAHSHTASTSESDPTTVSGSVTIAKGTGSANYTPEGTVENSSAAVTNIEVGTNSISAHKVNSVSTDGGHTPTGTITIDAYTPEGSVESHKHDVKATPTYVQNNPLESVTSTYTGPDGTTTNYNGSDGILTIGTTESTETYLSSVTVSDDAKAPTFTGTSKAPTGSFKGDAVAAHTHTVTIADHDAIVPDVKPVYGTHNHGFTGTGVNLVATHSLTAAAHNHSVTVENAIVAAHTVTAPTEKHAHGFTGNNMYVHAAFTGTAASHNHTFTGTAVTDHAVDVTVNNFTGNFSGTATGTVTPSVSKVLTGVSVAEHKISTVDSGSVTTGDGVQ